MKKIIFITALSLLPLMAFSQSYPSIKYDSITKKNIVSLTERQAQILDNKTDLEYLFEQTDMQIDSIDTAYHNVIVLKDSIIGNQKNEIDNLKKQNQNKSEQINTLKDEITKYDSKINVIEEQKSVLNKTIVQKDKIIKSDRIKMWIGGIGGGIAITTLLALLIF